MGESPAPRILVILQLLSALYAIVGIILNLIFPSETEITFMPAWFRRSLDAIFIILAVEAIKHYHINRPWRGIIKHQRVLWSSVINVLVHYGGMLPPVHIYDRVPWFNRVTHMWACFNIVWLSYVGREHKDMDWRDGAIAFGIGILWEVLEYLTVPAGIDYWTAHNVGYGWWDTKWDVVSNIVGIFLAMGSQRLLAHFQGTIDEGISS